MINLAEKKWPGIFSFLENDTLMIKSENNNHNFKPVTEEIHLLGTKSVFHINQLCI